MSDRFGYGEIGLEIKRDRPVSFTNGERLRRLTDEKLAAFLSSHVDCAFCTLCEGYGFVGSCEKEILLWLRKESDNGEFE